MTDIQPETPAITKICQEVAEIAAGNIIGAILDKTDRDDWHKHTTGMIVTTAAMTLAELLASTVPLAKEPEKFLDKVKGEVMDLVIKYAKIRADIIMKEGGGWEEFAKKNDILH